MKISFFKAPMALTKSYTRRADGTIQKTSYPNVYEVTSIEEDAASLHDLERLLKKHAALGHCLVKGNPTRALSCESRAGTTDSAASTEWIVFDVDGIPGISSIDEFMKAIHFGDVSYVVQWSASFGIPDSVSTPGTNAWPGGIPPLRAHVFVRLTKPLPAQLVKQWLIQLNHSTPMLHAAMALTKTGNAIHWPLDISACQNDKLLYIAPPILKGGIKDPMGKLPRIEYVKRSTETLMPAGAINSTAQNRVLNDKRINEIRAELGYPARKTTYKMHGNTEVMVKPDSCIISDMKTDRGFVYFNLNGGDSWGYYHPEENPDYIHNFKGEPAYLTKELLPEYWEQLTKQAVRTDSGGITYLAFLDRKTSAYWRGTYDANTDILDLNMAKNETQVRHFAKQHGMPLGDYIPEWDMEFDPLSKTRVDLNNQIVNTFQPTVYMQAGAKPKKTATCPKTIYRVINHALGGDAAITDHFMNWLAFILQFKDRTKTAWVLHGTQGTGKGILANNIIRPLLGASQTAMRRMEEFNEPYNGFMEKCFVVFVDEMQAKALINERGVMAKLFNFITEMNITVRNMHVAAHEVRNYCNWIFASNKADPVSIDKQDRRFNVAKYQPIKLVITTDEIEVTIPKELQAFHDYLMCRVVDVAQVNTPIESADRDNMISISESSIDTVGSALIEGNFEFFVDQLPTTEAYQTNALEANKVYAYIDVLKAMMARTKTDGSCNISRDELRTIFEYTIGGIPASPNKFTSLLKHHRIHISKVWVDKTVNGVHVDWKDIAKFPNYSLVVSPPPKPVSTTKLKAVK